MTFRPFTVFAGLKSSPFIEIQICLEIVYSTLTFDCVHIQYTLCLQNTLCIKFPARVCLEVVETREETSVRFERR